MTLFGLSIGHREVGPTVISRRRFVDHDQLSSTPAGPGTATNGTTLPSAPSYYF